ncbi:MAG: hypothetical protein ABGZ35_15975 [Planctomycetaceae bacterium]
MGLLDKIFGIDPTDPEDAQYEIAQASSLEAMGFPPHEARKTAKEAVQKARQIVIERGQQHEPRNYGDWLLSDANSGGQMKMHFETVRREGVTDDDIRDWWNRPPLERSLLEIGDEQNEMTAFLGAMEKGLAGDVAMVVVRRLHPIYGTRDPKNDAGDDAPLPYEFRTRVTYLTNLQVQSGEIQQRVQSQKSLNAVVREHIRDGKI